MGWILKSWFSFSTVWWQCLGLSSVKVFRFLFYSSFNFYTPVYARKLFSMFFRRLGLQHKLGRHPSKTKYYQETESEHLLERWIKRKKNSNVKLIVKLAPCFKRVTIKNLKCIPLLLVSHSHETKKIHKVWSKIVSNKNQESFRFLGRYFSLFRLRQLCMFEKKTKNTFSIFGEVLYLNFGFLFGKQTRFQCRLEKKFCQLRLRSFFLFRLQLEKVG